MSMVDRTVIIMVDKKVIHNPVKARIERGICKIGYREIARCILFTAF